ncbi:MAG: MYG1 family protein [Oscillospiraceae bacterium]|jgi:uncharacterized UPF0160 family protein|nr:MYG1 family protein [Oscillospiraceae bacterium]MCI1990982.1 MYG1 family protein [Oscillospiraceae bacterium]MCI2035295.1 MYG1 family protein [Oscillospiraceae bacterium]
MEVTDHALTHGGKFHADDVFSAALLKIIHPSVRVTRAFEVPENYDGIVFDIGRGKFDHHQRNAEVRENGIPYAAFGLLWRELGETVLRGDCPPEEAAKEAKRFDEHFIQPLDADDNTGCGSQLADAVGAFNPVWDSDRSPDDCFAEAVEFAEGILRRKLAGIFSVQRAKALVERALAGAQDRIVVLPRFAPWKAVLVPSDALFVVYPSRRGGYNAQVIPADFGTSEAKCAFPEEWAGKEDAGLRETAGIPTLNFCHKGRFLISAETLDGAVQACRAAFRKAEARKKTESENV